MIDTTRLFETVELQSNTADEDLVQEGLKGIHSVVNDDNVLKAQVLVTVLGQDGTVSHHEYNIDNESDMVTHHGFTAKGEFEMADNTFFDITRNTKMGIASSACEAQITIGEDKGFVLIPIGGYEQ